jgi:hypothetical protein
MVVAPVLLMMVELVVMVRAPTQAAVKMMMQVREASLVPTMIMQALCVIVDTVRVTDILVQ